MRLRAFLAVLLLAAAPLEAGAAGTDVFSGGAFSAETLRGLCTSKSDMDYGYCAGYVSAVAHAMIAQGAWGFRACNIASIRSQQLIDTFNTWAELFPERMGDEAGPAVAASFARAFPCTAAEE